MKGKEQLRGAKRFSKPKGKGTAKKGDQYTPESYAKSEGHRLRHLDQISHEALMKKKPKQLHTFLVQSGLLPDFRKFRCQEHGCKLSWEGDKGRCTKYKCTYTSTKWCFSPLHKTSVTEKQYASMANSWSLGMGAHQARLQCDGLHPGAQSDKKVYHVFRCFRFACSDKVLDDGHGMVFEKGEVEVDGTTLGTKRTDPQSTTFIGRLLGFKERASGKTLFIKVPDQKVAKGDPPVPESFQDVGA